jgi:hypothetical protein
VTNRALIAAASGLTERQVEAGLKALRDRGLVATEQHWVGGCNMMHVAPAGDLST